LIKVSEDSKKLGTYKMIHEQLNELISEIDE